MTQGLLRKMHKKNDKGFTLVELMIVVAIIGILAAIAIPQFAAYRIRGFNSSAISDVRNINTDEVTYYADWMVYGGTANAAVAAGMTAAVTNGLLTGPIATNMGFITSNDAAGTSRSQAVQAGNGVTIEADTNAGCTAVNITAKHTQGDTWFAIDSDASAIYFSQDKTATGIGVALTNADGVAPVVAADEYTGGAVTGPTTDSTNWAAK